MSYLCFEIGYATTPKRRTPQKYFILANQIKNVEARDLALKNCKILNIQNTAFTDSQIGFIITIVKKRRNLKQGDIYYARRTELSR